jgi:hypothetical protein
VRAYGSYANGDYAPSSPSPRVYSPSPPPPQQTPHNGSTPPAGFAAPVRLFGEGVASPSGPAWVDGKEGSAGARPRAPRHRRRPRTAGFSVFSIAATMPRRCRDDAPMRPTPRAEPGAAASAPRSSSRRTPGRPSLRTMTPRQGMGVEQDGGLGWEERALARAGLRRGDSTIL